MNRRPAFARTVLALVSGLVLVLTGLAGAPAAQAHTELASSTPANGQALAVAPSTVVLTFDEEPASVVSVRAEETGGGVVELGAPVLKGTQVTVAWPAGAAPGLYRLGWSLVSDDGDPVQGTIMFSYAAAAASAAPTVTPAGQADGAATTASEAHPSTGLAVAGVAVAAAVVLAAAGTSLVVLRRSRRRRTSAAQPSAAHHEVAETTVGR